MKKMKRKEFIKTTAKAGGAAFTAPLFIPNFLSEKPSDRVNVAVIGLTDRRPTERGVRRGRGLRHIEGYSQLGNVRVTAVCDVVERLFQPAVDLVEERYGITPDTYVDYRELLEDDEIDVVSLVTPNHWHALQTVWACQAGKDVYVEKPVSHNVAEGRIMVEADEKYERVVLAGMTYRFTKAVNEGIELLHSGKIGTPYMARANSYSLRPSIGRIEDSEIPEGVDWDRFLGPAPWRPFNKNRFIYNWHWMWDTGNGDIGNLGIYELDLIRWALKREHHPVSVHATGGVYVHDDDRETPNIMNATYEYEDDVLVQIEIRNHYTNLEGSNIRCSMIYTDEGWVEFTGTGYRAFVGRSREPEYELSSSDVDETEEINGWQELIDTVRNREIDQFRNNIIEGHKSAVLPHLANISYRTGKKLTFNPETERFINDSEADGYLSREYRAPYSMPDVI
jgi:predicted dehydrogenase